MTAKTEGSGSNSGEWAKIIKGAQTGTESAMKGRSDEIKSKQDVREAKRRMMANLLNKSLGRRQNSFEMGQDYDDELTNYKSDALRNMARGFVGALQGSTGK